MDEMSYEVTPTKNVGWISEAHRLSLGAKRPRKGTTAAINSNRFSRLALATCPNVEIARALVLQLVIRWFSTLKIDSGVHRSTV
jgi:hypothetical protein